MAKKRKVHTTRRFKRIRVESPKKFDKRSFRTLDIGRKGFTKLVIACPKGKYDAKTKKCKVGTRTQTILLNKKDFAGENIDNIRLRR